MNQMELRGIQTLVKEQGLTETVIQTIGFMSQAPEEMFTNFGSDLMNICVVWLGKLRNEKIQLTEETENLEIK